MLLYHQAIDKITEEYNFPYIQTRGKVTDGHSILCHQTIEENSLIFSPEES